MRALCFIAVSTMFFSAHGALAQSQPHATTNPDFKDVMRLFSSMTPEQQRAIFAQASINEKDIKNMSPSEKEALLLKMHQTADTLNMDKIDPNKLDVSQVKNTKAIQNDMETYQTKRQQGFLKPNEVVKPVNRP